MNKRVAAAAGAIAVVIGGAGALLGRDTCEQVTAHCGSNIITLQRCGDGLHVSTHVKAIRGLDRYDCTLDDDAGVLAPISEESLPLDTFHVSQLPSP